MNSKLVFIFSYGIIKNQPLQHLFQRIGETQIKLIGSRKVILQEQIRNNFLAANK